MKKIIVYFLVWIALLLLGIGLLVASVDARACDGIYFKVGAGYKLSEMDSIIYQGSEIEIEGISPYAARFELGYQRGMLTMGGAHYSQWETGWPFNDEKEPGTTSLFVDLRFDLWQF